LMRSRWESHVQHTKERRARLMLGLKPVLLDHAIEERALKPEPLRRDLR